MLYDEMLKLHDSKEKYILIKCRLKNVPENRRGAKWKILNDECKRLEEMLMGKNDCITQGNQERTPVRVRRRKRKYT